MAAVGASHLPHNAGRADCGSSPHTRPRPAPTAEADIPPGPPATLRVIVTEAWEEIFAAPGTNVTDVRKPAFSRLSPDSGDRRHAHVCSLPRCNQVKHRPKEQVHNNETERPNEFRFLEPHNLAQEFCHLYQVKMHSRRAATF